MCSSDLCSHSFCTMNNRARLEILSLTTVSDAFQTARSCIFLAPDSLRGKQRKFIIIIQLTTNMNIVCRVPLLKFLPLKTNAKKFINWKDNLKVNPNFSHNIKH